MDVDSTLVQGEVIELLAERVRAARTRSPRSPRPRCAASWTSSASLRARVALLAGVAGRRAFDEVLDAVTLTPGARTLVRTLKRLGYRFAIVSGGFSADHRPPGGASSGIDYAGANELEVVDGRLTGRLARRRRGPGGQGRRAARFAAEPGVPLSQTVAIGDGANDLDMLTRPGSGIAFNAKPVVREAADTAVNVPYLDAILYLLGITREEVEAADAEAGIRHACTACLRTTLQRHGREPHQPAGGDAAAGQDPGLGHR